LKGDTVTHRWTTADFDALSWHDCHVHGFRAAGFNEECGTCELELDIDFILEWLPQDDGTFLFRIAPATLTFHEVFGLNVLLDYATPGAGMAPFSLDGIERDPIACATGHTSYRWRLPVNWPAGQIIFDSPGFTQILTREPVVHGTQCLTANDRRR
jgi:hypothetical protein